MMRTQPFDFGRLVDGLTIEIRINEDHRRALRFQVLERFESRRETRRFRPPYKTVTAIVVGFGLLSIGLVVQQQMSQRSAPSVDTRAILMQVEAAAAARELDTVAGYLSIQSVPVQVAVINHLAVLGDATTLDKLKRLLQESNSPQIRQAAQAAIEAIRQRLQTLPAVEVNEPGHVLRFKVTDPQGRPLRGARVQAEAWWSCHTGKQGSTNAKGATTLTNLEYDDILYSVTKKGYHHVRRVCVESPKKQLLRISGRPFRNPFGEHAF